MGKLIIYVSGSENVIILYVLPQVISRTTVDSGIMDIVTDLHQTEEDSDEDELNQLMTIYKFDVV